MSGQLKKNKLTDMKLTEISLVDRPANEDARAVIVKRASGATPAKENAMGLKAKLQKFADDSVLEHDDADLPEGDDIDIDGEGEGEELDLIAEEDVADLEDAMDIVEALLDGEDEDEEVTKIAKGLQAAVRFLEVAEALDEAARDGAQTIAKMQIRESELAAQIKKMGVEPITKAADEIDLDALPDDIRKMVAVDRAKTEAALQEVAKLRAEQERKDFIAEVKKRGVPAPEAVADLLIRVTKGLSTSDDADFILELIESGQNAAQHQDLLKSFGERAGGEADAFDVRLAAAVEPILKAASAAGQTMTKEQAIAKAYQDNPALYEEYQRARRARWYSS